MLTFQKIAYAYIDNNPYKSVNYNKKLLYYTETQIHYFYFSG